MTSIRDAVIKKDFGSIDNMIKNKTNHDIYRVFMMACKLDNIDVLKYMTHARSWLYEDGIAVYACQNDRVEIVDYLLSRYGIEYQNGQSALASACRRGSLDIVKCLGKYIDVATNYRAIVDASNKGHFHILDYLIERGADINKDIIIRQAPLDTVKYLIERGVDSHYITNKSMRHFLSYGYIEYFGKRAEKYIMYRNYIIDNIREVLLRVPNDLINIISEYIEY